MRAIRAVIFDWGGVLTTSPMPPLLALERELGYAHRQLVDWMFCTGLCTSGRPADGEQRPDSDFQLLEKGLLSFEGYFERILACSAEHLGAPMAREASQELRARFAVDAGVAAFSWPMIHRARRLRADGYRTAILTNQIPSWREFWRSSVPLEDFDVVVDSCEVGMRKPEPGIFRHACDLLGVDPTEAVMLDDSPRNAAGAGAVGMASIVVRDSMTAIAELDELLSNHGRGGASENEP
jgi:epoxide hydrolase-like predicted phosphatase